MIDQKILDALANFETIVAPLEAKTKGFIAWLTIHRLVELTAEGELQYRVRAIEVDNKYIKAYEEGLEVNPEEIAINYEIAIAKGNVELEKIVLKYLQNTNSLILYSDSVQRYPN